LQQLGRCLRVRRRGRELEKRLTQVPGSREWLTPAIYLLGPDYSLATTFFRPSLSQGIWISGQPVYGLYYRVMLCNGFNTLGSSPQELDARMTLSGSVWAEPLSELTNFRRRGLRASVDQQMPTCQEPERQLSDRPCLPDPPAAYSGLWLRPGDGHR